MSAKIVELDFGMGNIRSLQKAFEHCGAEVTVTDDVSAVRSADVLLLPGDGAFERAMHELKSRKLFDEVLEAHAKQKIIFGVCIGFQILFENSTEFKAQDAGFSLLKGAITRLEKNAEASKIPHIGWTTTDFKKNSLLGKGIPEQTLFYYVHSYAHIASHPYATATTNYGQVFTSAIEHENLFAVQFHPEKSHRWGLQLIQNFLSFINS